MVVTSDPLDTVDGGQTTGLAGVTKQKSGWILKQNMESLPGSHYTIVDEKRNPAFEVLISRSILFLNPEGDRVAYLRKKFLAMRPVWTMFTFKPNYKGQKSTDETAGIGESKLPLYRYGSIDSTVLTLLAEFQFHRFLPEDNDAWFSPPYDTKVEYKANVWSAKVIIAWRFKLGVRKVDGKEEIAKIGQDAFFTFDPATE